MREHLYTHNLVDSPICRQCNLENESVSHFLLRCPVFTNERVIYLSDLLNVVNGNYLAGLRDKDIVNLFLYGNPEFPWESNVLLFKMAQTYITTSKRFDGRPYH